MAKARVTGQPTTASAAPEPANARSNALRGVDKKAAPVAPQERSPTTDRAAAGAIEPGEDVELKEREEMIRQAAYHRYLQRGGQGGSAESDWLAAEAEMDQPGPQTQGRRQRP